MSNSNDDNDRDGEEENNGDNDSDSDSDGNGKGGQRGQDDNMKKPRKIQFFDRGSSIAIMTSSWQENYICLNC